MKWELSLYHVYCVVLFVLIDRLLIWQHVDKDTFTTGFSLLKYLLKQAYTTIQMLRFGKMLIFWKMSLMLNEAAKIQ